MWIGFFNTHMHMQNAQKSQSVASSSKLEFARFSTLLRIQDRAKCNKGTELNGGWWGHRTTLKGNILGNPPDTFKTPSIEHYRHLPDIFRHLSEMLKHIPDISHTSPRHPRLREEYKS